MVYNNSESEEKATINGEIISNDVKQIMNHIRHLPFNIGSATLKEDNGIDELLRYCDSMIEKGKLKFFIDEMFETINDSYIKIGVVDSKSRAFTFSWKNPSRDSMFETLKNSELLGIMGLYLKSKEAKEGVNYIFGKILILAEWNRNMGLLLISIDGMFSDLSDWAASDLERIAEQIRG